MPAPARRPPGSPGSPGSTRQSRRASRSAGFLAAAGLLVGPCLLVGNAAAQDGLPAELIRTEARLSDEQADRLRTYVRSGMDALLAAEGIDATAAARQGLTGPLTAIGATPAFVQQYGRELAAQVGSLPDDATTPERVNALLLLRTTPVQEAVPVVQPSLDAADPAVRFTAAKVILDLLRTPQEGNPPLDGATRRRLQEQLESAAGTEVNAYVVGKLLPALQTLNGDDNRSSVTATLNQRVEVHAANPETGYLPELAEMSGLFLRNLGRFQRSEAAQLCRASARYLKLVSEQLQAGLGPRRRSAGRRADAHPGRQHPP